MVKKGELVPYDLISPGFEAIYQGTKDRSALDDWMINDDDLFIESDKSGNLYLKHSFWTLSYKPDQWTDEIKIINGIQESLGELDNTTRYIRNAIGSLVLCDQGIPTTIDQLLDFIGSNYYDEKRLFHLGCWMPSGKRSTNPDWQRSMTYIEEILVNFLKGMSITDQIKQLEGFMEGFIRRFYSWFPSRVNLDELQVLLLNRILVSFPYLTHGIDNHKKMMKDVFEIGGKGWIIDEQIQKLEDLPQITGIKWNEARKYYKTIKNQKKKERFRIISYVTGDFFLSGLSTCHHNLFRFLENVLYKIGTLTNDPLPNRFHATERKRLGNLLFGYVLGLNSWLMKKPMDILLLDLGYLDLGFNQRNEILRVYAYLANNRNPVKEWLVGSLWHQLMFNEVNLPRTPGLINHKDMLELAKKHNLNLFEWMESKMGL
ncbi:MAG: hypothetical protein ACW98D_12630 [Promethearchaeota archaeon]|jgi:hypothetical protein